MEGTFAAVPVGGITTATNGASQRCFQKPHVFPAGLPVSLHIVPERTAQLTLIEGVRNLPFGEGHLPSPVFHTPAPASRECARDGTSRV